MSAVSMRPLAAVPRPDRALATARISQGLAGCSGAVDRERLIQQLIEANLGVADGIASRYSGRGVPDDDLQQVARLALVRAARGFDPDRGYDFLGYAVPSIRGELRRYFRDCGWTVRPPRRVQEAQLRMNAARGSLCQELGHEPRTGDFVEALGLDRDTVTEALRVNHCYHPDSLDRPQDPAPDGGSALSSPAYRFGADDPEFARCEARVLIEPLVADLAERDQLVLRLRFVEGLTQREIGEQIGVTQMQVSRILSRLLDHLREALELPVTA